MSSSSASSHVKEEMNHPEDRHPSVLADVDDARLEKSIDILVDANKLRARRSSRNLHARILRRNPSGRPS